VDPAAESAEHPDGGGGIGGLAEEAAVEDHLGVGAQDGGGVIVGNRPGHRPGLGERDGDDGLVERARRMLFGDGARQDGEGDAEPS
jgi:hypothetical protein